MRGAPLGQVRAGALRPGQEKAVLIVRDLPERAQPHLRRAGAGLQLLQGRMARAADGSDDPLPVSLSVTSLSRLSACLVSACLVSACTCTATGGEEEIEICCPIF